MAEFLSERKLLFVRKKFDFPSKKNSFSFGQKFRRLKSVFSSIAVKFPIHRSAIPDALFCPFFTRLRELFPIAVFALLKPKFMFLGFRRKIQAKIMRHKINLRIFKFHEYNKRLMRKGYRNLLKVSSI